ncbi:MAG: hypothetical protein V3T84_18025, partial [Phycisphaerales bacterium]
MHLRSTPRGLTRTEALAVLLVILVAVTVVIVMLIPSRNRPLIARARSLKDVAQLQVIHQSWIVATREFNATAPLPSLAGLDENE